MSISAMKQALDDICSAKLCEINSMSSRAEMIRLMDKAITALRQALEQPDLARVGEVGVWGDKREWVGLTDDEVHDAFNFVEFVKQVSFDRDRPEWCENFAAYLEAKLKEKNS